eukprot:11155486-Lingulodinium_polyedra.AAC.1
MHKREQPLESGLNCQERPTQHPERDCGARAEITARAESKGASAEGEGLRERAAGRAVHCSATCLVVG